MQNYIRTIHLYMRRTEVKGGQYSINIQIKMKLNFSKKRPLNAFPGLCLIGSLSLPQSTSVTHSQCVKAGTEEKLVLHLLHSFSMGDSSFIAVFLSTYRSFTSTRRVLDILIDRWGTGWGWLSLVLFYLLYCI